MQVYWGYKRYTDVEAGMYNGALQFYIDDEIKIDDISVGNESEEYIEGNCL
jgi:hypothetical protein